MGEFAHSVFCVGGVLRGWGYVGVLLFVAVTVTRVMGE